MHVTKLKLRKINLEVEVTVESQQARSAHISLGMSTLRADTSADAQLAKMGYKAELPRNLSMMSILGLYVFCVAF